MGRLAWLRVGACVLALGWFVVAPGCAGDTPKDTSCHGDLYDPCTTEHDCQDMMCMPFGSFESCTQVCTPGDNSTCPKQGGKAATCNASGLCEPTAPNTCMLP